ncbi:MAG TPA: isochorismatase family protein [Azospirillaceae bacterium]|nr:isochorismatase family protein [Azospirillaceae bacterium]
MLLTAPDSVLALVDFQGRLMPAIDHGSWVQSRALLLARAARLLSVPVLATEQNPAGLGHTAADLAAQVDRTVEKSCFDSCRAPDFLSVLPEGRRTIVLAGVEAHVCVLQTAFGLKAAGYRAVIAADAVGSRRAADKEAGLARMRAAGIEVVTAEMAVFEWLEDCAHPHFREALKLIR